MRTIPFKKATLETNGKPLICSYEALTWLPKQPSTSLFLASPLFFPRILLQKIPMQTPKEQMRRTLEFLEESNEEFLRTHWEFIGNSKNLQEQPSNPQGNTSSFPSQAAVSCSSDQSSLRLFCSGVPSM